MADDEPEYDLVLPFVTVQSVGGPHDDDAYTAGWAMGALDALMDRHPLLLTGTPITVREDCQAQADLIAMRHGYSTTFDDSGTDGYLFMVLAVAMEVSDD